MSAVPTETPVLQPECRTDEVLKVLAQHKQQFEGFKRDTQKNGRSLRWTVERLEGWGCPMLTLGISIMVAVAIVALVGSVAFLELNLRAVAHRQESAVFSAAMPKLLHEVHANLTTELVSWKNYTVTALGVLNHNNVVYFESAVAHMRNNIVIWPQVLSVVIGMAVLYTVFAILSAQQERAALEDERYRAIVTLLTPITAPSPKEAVVVEEAKPAPVVAPVPEPVQPCSHVVFPPTNVQIADK